MQATVCKFAHCVVPRPRALVALRDRAFGLVPRRAGSRRDPSARLSDRRRRYRQATVCKFAHCVVTLPAGALDAGAARVEPGTPDSITPWPRSIAAGVHREYL